MGKHHHGQPFDLCADDHCQRYWGFGYGTETSNRAVEETGGEILMYGGEVCDARYSKICGGVMESYESVWEERAVPYLRVGVDGEVDVETDLRTEEKVAAYIDSSPDVYCNTATHSLPQGLAASAQGLFRWEIHASATALSGIIRRKTGQDIGLLQEIRPVKRSPAGRLMYVDLVGSEKTLRVGKELEIRRVLSESHLYSSCFYVVRQGDGFTFRGGGWGHGVGLCQVGAAVMAQEGKAYGEILAHYYPGTRLKKVY